MKIEAIKMIDFKHLILGKPLKNSDIKNEKLSRLWGLPIMASDAVSSVAYACEEILLVLVPVIGAYSFGIAPLVTLPIILLLLILIVSYSQIIDHYPNGGGAYNVSKENLGKYPSLIAASSLVVDYIMTVAVSISSATAAITSAFPSLLKYGVPVALIFLALITLGNLRGVRESSKMFGMPTYIFIFAMGIMIITGLIRLVTGTMHPLTYSPTTILAAGGMVANLQKTMTGLTLVIVLHAFSSGCTALTGVEAVSNAIPNFKEPSQKNAKSVLFMLGGVIVFIFGGTTLLEMNLRVLPLQNVTVISQIAASVFGSGAFVFMYYIIQIFTALILILAANTAYNGLPLLLYILGRDNFVPRQFAHRGTKLSFSNGIMFIFVIAGLLIWQFHADTHRLIPMYTIGVFISFTLSQYGMFKRWIRTKDKGWHYKMWVNGFGAIMTLVGTFVVIYNKFLDGAWVVIIAIPAIMMIMIYVNHHYCFIGKQLELKKFFPYYDKTYTRSTQCIVLLQEINKSLLKALNYANSISDNITILHVCRHPGHAEALQKQWDSLNIPLKFEVVLTPYQDIIKPFNEYIWSREAKLNHGENLSVIIVKYVSDHWYDSVLHNQTTYFLERILSKHKNVCSIILPFHYNPSKIKCDTAEIKIKTDK
jgi:amino acid transporter